MVESFTLGGAFAVFDPLLVLGGAFSVLPAEPVVSVLGGSFGVLGYSTVLMAVDGEMVERLLFVLVDGALIDPLQT